MSRDRTVGGVIQALQQSPEAGDGFWGGADKIKVPCGLIDPHQ